MSIKKKMEFDGSKYHGYVDIGTGVPDDSMLPATEVLVLMVVAINGSWEIPIGNFMIYGLKLRKAFIEWRRMKMKVILACQTLSRSVADV
uniref:THAP domaincontaining protein 9like [Strongylocentrotus purpuratus] n=1 Tax=Lepeophtheirus salmonis TaxID=72036 RepID=A0A0K2UDE3_LEPSM